MSGVVELVEGGKVKVDKKNCCTSRAGVFAAKDVTHTTYNRVIISPEEGAKAALSTYNSLQNKRGGSPTHSELLNSLETKRGCIAYKRMLI